MSSGIAENGAEFVVNFVIGMHRSGTSLLARSLNLAGLRQFDNMLDANTYNATGYWEPKEVVEFNDLMLVEMGRHWADPKPLPEKWKNRRGMVKNAKFAADLIRKERVDGDGLVLKDPRISRVMPFWCDAVARCDGQAVCFIAFRNPVDVYRSLHRRDSLDFEHAMALWQSYVLEAEAGTRGMRRVFIHYDAMLDDWAATLRGAFAAMELRAPEGLRANSAAINSFVDRGQRHHSATLGEMRAHPEIGDDVKRCYELMLDNAGSERAEEFDEIRARWQHQWKARSAGKGASPFMARIPSWHYEQSKVFFAQGRKTDAISSVKRAIELGSDGASMHHHLGNLLAGVGRLEDACVAQKQAISRDPSVAGFHLALGRILVRIGRKSEARLAV